jgi:hypothetical protein
MASLCLAEVAAWQQRECAGDGERLHGPRGTASKMCQHCGCNFYTETRKYVRCPRCMTIVPQWAAEQAGS